MCESEGKIFTLRLLVGYFEITLKLFVSWGSVTGERFLGYFRSKILLLIVTVVQVGYLLVLLYFLFQYLGFVCRVPLFSLILYSAFQLLWKPSPVVGFECCTIFTNIFNFQLLYLPPDSILLLFVCWWMPLVQLESGLILFSFLETCFQSHFLWRVFLLLFQLTFWENEHNQCHFIFVLYNTWFCC